MRNIISRIITELVTKYNYRLISEAKYRLISEAKIRARSPAALYPSFPEPNEHKYWLSPKTHDQVPAVLPQA